MWGGKSRSGSDLYFFIYDEYAIKSEYDVLEEAVMYYQPKNVIDLNEIYLLIGQLVGMVRFTEQLSGSVSSILTLEKMKFTIAREDHFLMFLGTSESIPNLDLKSKLQRFCDIFIFYHGSIKQLLQKNNNVKADLISDLDLICSSYISYILKYGDKLEATFNPLSTVKFDKQSSKIFMKMTHMLEACQRIDYVLSGCVFSERRLVCSQLPQWLVEKLILLKPHQTNYAAAKVNLGYECPFGVRLFRIYVTQDQYEDLQYEHSMLSHCNSTENQNILKKTSKRYGFRNLNNSVQVQDSLSDTVSTTSFLKSSETMATVTQTIKESESSRDNAKAHFKNGNKHGKKLNYDNLSNRVNRSEGFVESGASEKSSHRSFPLPDTNQDNLLVPSLCLECSGKQNSKLEKLGNEIIPSPEDIISNSEVLSKDDFRTLTPSTETLVSNNVNSGDGTLYFTGSEHYSDKKVKKSNYTVSCNEIENQSNEKKTETLDQTSEGKEETVEDTETKEEIVEINDNSTENNFESDHLCDNIDDFNGANEEIPQSSDDVTVSYQTAPVSQPSGNKNITKVNAASSASKNNNGKNSFQSSVDKNSQADSTHHTMFTQSNSAIEFTDTRVAEFVLNSTATDDSCLGNSADFEGYRTDSLADKDELPSLPSDWRHAVQTESGLIELHLYIQAHSKTMLLLLFDPQESYEKAVLQNLGKITLPLLGDIEAQIKSLVTTKEEYLSDKHLEYATYLTYDNENKKLEGNLKNGVLSADSFLIDTINKIHCQFQSSPALKDVTLKTNASALYARQSPHEEIYFQPRGNYRPTKGAPNNTDIAWRLDQCAMRKIDKTKMML